MEVCFLRLKNDVFYFLQRVGENLAEEDNRPNRYLYPNFQCKKNVKTFFEEIFAQKCTYFLSHMVRKTLVMEIIRFFLL